MFGYAELKHAFNGMDLADKPVIFHASLKKFGNIQGGAATVIQVMRESFNGVIAPTFTYKTMALGVVALLRLRASAPGKGEAL